MDTKHIHCMLEKMAEYGKCMVEEGAGSGNVNLEDAKKVVEMVGELAEAEYHALIAKEMRKAHEEDEAEEKYFLKMLKEEYKDEYKRMREEYGDSEETDRRFYDAWRYKSSGRFAPKGRGTRYGRRSYTEPPYYHVNPEMMESDPEYWRDVDREKGRLYYTPMNGNSGMNNADGKTYVDGVNEGTRRGYSDGYEKGMEDGKRSGNNSQSRSDRMRRNYTENKHMNGNSPEGKKKNMENLDSYMKELAGEMTELVDDMDASEKNMLKTRLQTLVQKIQ